MAADAAVAAVFEPVQTATTFEETVDRLGTAIRLGILAPGSRLPSERELADQLAISRSTLRQAITALVESGHLTSVRGRSGGTFVVPEPPLAEGSPGPLPDGWRQVLDLRFAIETGVAVLAAERAAPGAPPGGPRWGRAPRGPPRGLRAGSRSRSCAMPSPAWRRRPSST